jgi:hypothetical protein
MKMLREISDSEKINSSLKVGCAVHPTAAAFA